MRHISGSSRRIVPVVCAFALATGAAAVPMSSDIAAKEDGKPSIRVKASPVVSFAPARVTLTAEVRGGADDYHEFYCATVEWDWGDGTKAEAKTDCEPYEAGKSEIKRRYTYTRVFRTAGDYNVHFRLKQKDKTVGSGRTTIKVRPGLYDRYGDDR